MRKAFHQFFRPAPENLSDLWQHGLLCFDASVLLNVYGYSRKTRDELVELIEKNALRTRLPHQFGWEFARNRSSVIVKQVHNYLKVEDALRKIWEEEIDPKRDHPYLSKKASRAYQSIRTELEDSRRAMEKLVGADPYAERMFDIFDGRVGKCPTAEERSQMEAEAQKRYDNQIPPGFADVKDKGVPDCYGDCIAWLQLMEIAKAEKKGVILVIDDVKEDWWLLERKRTLGPRPELLEEFTRVAEQRFYMYNSESFLRAAKEFASAEIGDDVIEEVRLRAASQREQVSESLKSVPIQPNTPDGEKGLGASLDSRPDVKSSLIADTEPHADKFGPRVE
jgi:hypothetical protein